MKRAVRTIAAMGATLGALGCGDDRGAEPLTHAPTVGIEIRPDTPGNNLLHKFGPTDDVEVFGSPGGGFLVHFTRMGPNAVPAKDDDGSTTPDFVEEVASVYDEVNALYHDDLGFRAPVSDEGIPDNGGDGRFDVYLVDFAGVADGAFEKDECEGDKCAGYMVQENDYVGYGYPSTLIANRILGSHEFFHAVQAAYDSGQSTIVSEGTAVWATETFDPSLKDFEAFLPGYMVNCDRSLEVPLPGPVDPFSYGSAIFFWFLEERYGDGMVRALWERLENGANGTADPIWYGELEPLAEEKASVPFEDAFVEFATWNLFTGDHADPARSYDAGSGYSDVKMEPVTAPLVDTLRIFHSSSQYFALPPDGRAVMTAALVPTEEHPDAADGLSVLLAVDRDSSYDAVVRIVDPKAGSETVDTTGASQLVVVIVNGQHDGDSKKPVLCIGTVEEVAACKADNAVGAGGAGGGGDGGSTSSGSNAGPADPPSEDEGGCGCRQAPSPPGFYVPALVGLLVLARARRRRPLLRANH